MKEKHLVLVDNIGTYAKEDKAYELLNSLSIALPLVVIITAVFDALLAVVYLMWFHPWKIILQEVSTRSGLLVSLVSFPNRSSSIIQHPKKR